MYYHLILNMNSKKHLRYMESATRFNHYYEVNFRQKRNHGIITPSLITTGSNAISLHPIEGMSCACRNVRACNSFLRFFYTKIKVDNAFKTKFVVCVNVYVRV